MKGITIIPVLAILSLSSFAQKAKSEGAELSKPDIVALMHSADKSSPLVKSVKLSNGVSLDYVEQGDATGTPVIFLHGLTDSWRSFEPLLPYLRSTTRAFAVTLRGHGNSDKPKTYRPEDFAKDVNLFMKKLNIDAAVLVGHSMGGSVAQRFAIDYPGETLGLVLVGAFASFADKPSMVEFREFIHTLEDPIPMEVGVEFQKSTIVNAISREYFDVFVAETMKVPARVWRGAIDGLFTADYVLELKNVEKPTLLVRGEKDDLSTLGDLQRLAGAISDSEFLIYEDTGHAIHWERPQRFAMDLETFLQSLREGSVHRSF